MWEPSLHLQEKVETDVGRVIDDRVPGLPDEAKLPYGQLLGRYSQWMQYLTAKARGHAAAVRGQGVGPRVV